MPTKQAHRVKRREFDDDDSIIKALSDKNNKFDFKFKKREFKITTIKKQRF
jgi:hypothetical protein